jgi:hypothetical protein
MQDWHSTCLGRRTLPRDLSAFEIEAFFNFSDTERRVIEDRRGPALKLALALQIGFLRMTGRILEAVRIVPPALWRHLGEQLGVAAPDLASLRSMYQRRRTLFEHQEVACEMLGIHWLSEAQRRALVRVLRGEPTRTSHRQRLLQFARRWLYEHRLIVLRDRDLRTMMIKAIREHGTIRCTRPWRSSGDYCARCSWPTISSMMRFDVSCCACSIAASPSIP